jgi:hypothetical protein
MDDHDLLAFGYCGPTPDVSRQIGPVCRDTLTPPICVIASIHFAIHFGIEAAP